MHEKTGGSDNGWHTPRTKEQVDDHSVSSLSGSVVATRMLSIIGHNWQC